VTEGYSDLYQKLEKVISLQRIEPPVEPKGARTFAISVKWYESFVAHVHNVSAK
jgi:hypothetical protein